MKRRIAQIVDSAGSIPREIIDRYHIGEVAFHIYFGQQEYRENIDISSQDFYEHMKQQPDQIPKTSAPGVSEWTEAFEQKYHDGYKDIIVTTIAQPLSASFQSAAIAAHAFVETYPDVNVQIVDAHTCACGQEALEIKIAGLIEPGLLDLNELVKRVKELIPRVVSLFSVNELTYMRAGGRIGGATAFLGKLINIKPVCEFVDGVVKPIKAMRSRTKALSIMVDEAVKRIKRTEEAVICVQHALCEENAEFLIAQLREKLDFGGPIYQSPVGAVVGAHSGPGAIGIGIVEG
ncbi:MAG: DegV family protein [Syntrophomonas sp.]